MCIDCTDQRSEHRSTHIGAVLLAAGIVLGGLLAPASGHAQYPSRPIKLIVSSAPGSVPDAVLARLRAEINRVLPMPEVKERLNAAGGLEPYVTTPQEFAERIRSDYEKYGKLVKQIGAKVD